MPEAKLEVLISARDEASRILQGIQGNIQRMSHGFKVAGGIIAASGGIVTGMMAMAVKGAAEEEAGITRLSVAMGNMGISYDEVKGSLEAWIDAQQQKTAVADDEQRNSLSQLIRMTGNLEEAQDKLTLAMDIAAGTDKDLAAANQMVMYAMGGNWGMVERYIPALKDATTAEEKWALLRKLFAGQAEEYGKTMDAQMKLLMHNIGDVKDAIGKIIIKAIQPLVKNLAPILQSIKAWIDEHPRLTKIIVIATAAIGLLLIPLGGFLILLPMLAAGIATVTAVSSPWLLIIGAIIVGIIALVAAGVLVYKNWETIWNWAKKVKDRFIELKNSIVTLVSEGIDWLRDRLLALIEPFRVAWNWISKLIGGLNAIPRNITTTVTTIEQTIPAEAGMGRAKGFPLMQRGGVMPFTGLAFLHKGETVLPANTTITIPIYLDGELIAERVVERAGNKARLRGY